jgi:hypothetical protein
MDKGNAVSGIEIGLEGERIVSDNEKIMEEILRIS